MTIDDKNRWDERYSSGDYQPRVEASPLVELAIHYVTPGPALVLACGAGRNALRLAEAGFDVHAIDVSPVAVDMARSQANERGLRVAWQVGDLNTMRFDISRYDLITMIRYNNRDLWPSMTRALTPDGWLVLEQHLRTEREVVGPGPELRLEPGELLEAFSAMRIVELYESYHPVEGSDAMSALTGLLACSGDPGW